MWSGCIKYKQQEIFEPISKSYSEDCYIKTNKKRAPYETKYQKHFPYTAHWKTPEDFVCTYSGCHKTYRFKWVSENHITTVHEGLEFKCAACGNKFSKRANLRAHERQSCHFRGNTYLKKEDKLGVISNNFLDAFLHNN